jgi:type I restriction enzyme S subunit
LATISKLSVAQPKNKDEQQFIADAIDRCTDSIDAEKKILAKYQSLKHGLMQDLLTGEVSVEILLEEHITANS